MWHRHDATYTMQASSPRSEGAKHVTHYCTMSTDFVIPILLLAVEPNVIIL